MKEKFLKAIEIFKEKTVKECYKVSYEEKEVGILDDKLGGTPYLPINEEYPVTSKGTPMGLLLQVNLKNVDLKGYPKKGILEIFTDKEGEVILKKYSPIGELSEFATEYAETLAKTTGHIACITDKDTIIAVSGGSKKEFLEQDISKELEQLMEDKEVYTSKDNSDIAMPITKNENQERKYNAQVVYPIISNGDTIGTVILISKEAKGKMNDVEKKVAQSAATFLGSQMEI